MWQRFSICNIASPILSEPDKMVDCNTFSMTIAHILRTCSQNCSLFYNIQICFLLYRKISFVIPHESYFPGKNHFDIAVIKSDRPFTITTEVMSILLAPPNFEPKGNWKVFQLTLKNPNPSLFEASP